MASVQFAGIEFANQDLADQFAKDLLIGAATVNQKWFVKDGQAVPSGTLRKILNKPLVDSRLLGTVTVMVAGSALVGANQQAFIAGLPGVGSLVVKQ